jgi:hypothetical protein
MGRVVNWNQTPSFLHVSVLLDPGVEVRPGQFTTPQQHPGQRNGPAQQSAQQSIEDNRNVSVHVAC